MQPLLNYTWYIYLQPTTRVGSIHQTRIGIIIFGPFGVEIIPPYRHIRRNRYLDLDAGIALDLGCERGSSVCRKGHTFRSRDRLLLKGYHTIRGQTVGKKVGCCGGPGSPRVHPRVSYRLPYKYESVGPA